MKHALSVIADARIGIGGSIEPAVRRASLNSRAGERSRGIVDNTDAQTAHRLLPEKLRKHDLLFAASVGVEYPELRESALVRDVGDPLAVGGPARMKVVMIAEGELIGRAARNGQNVKMIELV